MRKQHRDALDVGDHLASLRDDGRQVRELAVQQHQPGDGLRGGRPGVHCDADVGRLDRERVVDPVAGHGDGVAAGLQRGDHPLLLRGRDPPEHLVRVEDLAELRLVGGECARVVALRDVQPHFPRDGGDGAGVVARDDPDADALLPEVLQRLGGIGADLLAEGQQHDRDEAGRQGLGLGLGGGEGCRGVREHKGAPAGRRELGDPAAEVAGVVGGGVTEDHLGGFHDPGAARLGNRAPFAGGRERDGGGRSQPVRVGEGVREHAGAAAG